MKEKGPEPESSPSPEERGEGLYSWANVRGTGYRDFSASRHDVREQFRLRAVAERTSKPTPGGPEPAAPESAPSDRLVRPSWHEWPQWLNPEPAGTVVSAGARPETLQQAKERVASRWFALRSVAVESQEAAEPGREMHTPVLAVFSLAGGVGKTSLVATLGRALASHGERVLLADTTSYGLLPFYFGSRELRPGVVRTFSPPSGSTDAPVNVVSLEAERYAAEASGNDPLLGELERSSRGANRVLVDVGTGAHGLVSRLLRLSAGVLLPLLPDMNSVVSVGAIEEIFRSQRDAQGKPVELHYVLDQFDEALPLHLDVREVLRQRLGDRLLPFVLRRSPAISEALAEGMTVMDYAPGSSLAEDFMTLAAWLRSRTAPAVLGSRGVRWSER